MIYIAIFKINGKFKTNATAVYLEFIVLTIYIIIAAVRERYNVL